MFNRSVLEYLRLLFTVKLTGNTNANIHGMQTNAQRQAFTNQVENLALPQLLLIIRLFLRSYKELSNAALPELPLLLAAIEASMFGLTQSASNSASVPAPAVISATKKAPEAKSETKSVAKYEEPVISASATELAHTEENVVMATEDAIEDDRAVTMEEIQNWWPDIVSHVKTGNSPIATLLKNSPIIEVNDGKITIAVKYLFHKEHIDNKKHAAMIMESIQAVCGKKLSIRAVIKNDIREPAISQTVDALSDALKVFGGELVE